MTKEMIKKAYNTLGQEYYDTRKYKSGSSYFYNEMLEMPATLRLLGNVKGKKILDFGCGPGLYAKILKDNGADVKGIDISKELIKIAKKEAPGVEFVVGDATKNLPYKKGEFDIVLATLVMGHFKNWKDVLKEISRVLNKRGIFIFSIYNPVTEKTEKTRWFFKTFRQIKNYFEEGWKYALWGGKAKGAHYHKTYGTIIKLLVNNGFDIVDYEDCKPLKAAKKQFPREYEKTLNSPHFCVWKTKKK